MAALVFALGPGHNIPLLGETPAVTIFLVITGASILGLTKLWVFPPLLTLAGG